MPYRGICVRRDDGRHGPTSPAGTSLALLLRDRTDFSTTKHGFAAGRKACSHTKPRAEVPMGRDNVLSLSTARLRLDARVLRQAEALARLAGVSVTELIELLLQGFIDCDERHRESMVRPRARAHAAASSPARRAARLLDLEEFRRRRGVPGAVISCDAPQLPPHLLRAHASRVRRRAVQARTRGNAAREAAVAARTRAKLILAQLHGLATSAM
jgi:hypothetical protein